MAERPHSYLVIKLFEGVMRSMPRLHDHQQVAHKYKYMAFGLKLSNTKM